MVVYRCVSVPMPDTPAPNIPVPHAYPAISGPSPVPSKRRIAALSHESGRTEVFSLAEFVRKAAFDQIGPETLEQLEIRVLDIRAQDSCNVHAVQSVSLRTFDIAYAIIGGGGEEGSKHHIRTKEEADHSLPYMIAVALLDGWATPDQYAPERIVADDVQSLLAKVSVAPDPVLTAAFPAKLPAELDVVLADGTRFSASRDDYEGFFTHPLTWERARAKFDHLASPFASETLRDRIAQTVRGLEKHGVSDLTALVREVSRVRNAEFAHA